MTGFECGSVDIVPTGNVFKLTVNGIEGSAEADYFAEKKIK